MPTFTYIYACGDSNAQEKGEFHIQGNTVTFGCPVIGSTGALECPDGSVIVGAGCDVTPLADVDVTVLPLITSLFQSSMIAGVTQANNCQIDCSTSPVAGDVEVTPFAVCLEVG